MTGARQRLLPAGVVALTLHTGLLFWQFAEPSPTLPTALATQRVTVSLGVKALAEQPPPDPKQDKKPPVEKKVLPPVTPVPMLPKQSPTRKPAAVLPATKARDVIPKTVQEKAQAPAKSEQQRTVSSPEEQQPPPEPVVSSFLAERKNESGQALAEAAWVIQEATPLYHINPPPKYPRQARRRGLEGLILLEALVDISGRVADLKLSSSCGHSILDRAALKAVRSWCFTPGTIGGNLQEMWVKVPVRFQLR